MSVIDLARLSAYVDIPKRARLLLEKPEKEMSLRLSVRTGADEMLITDCFVVYYNTARGAAKGGIRMSAQASLEGTRRLAELMVWKTALTHIPFGGGKSGICLDPDELDSFEKSVVMQEYVHILKEDLLAGSYIPAPDMGTGPREMAIIFGELHIPQAVTGKPTSVGGLPGRREATGRGVATCAACAAPDMLGKPIGECTVAVQGFGNVGSHSAWFLAQQGARIVAASHITGGLYNARGIDVEQALARSPQETFDGLQGDAISNEDLLGLPVDVLIPAAAGGVITEEVAGRLRCKLIVEGANDPVTGQADEVLAEAGIVDVPDILANAGGVIASYVEWRNAKSGSFTSKKEVYDFIDQILSRAFERVIECASALGVPLRRAAQVLALQEVVTSMQERGWL